MEHDHGKPVEIKDLNKTQLILLALLLSFVTSIATGIVTITLMQQAPPQVNQTITRVVENTIEKVVPDYTATKTQTVVVKEDDLVVDVVSKTRKNFFEVYAGKESTIPITDIFSLGSGVFIDASVITESGKTYYIKNGDNLVEAKNMGISSLGFGVLYVSGKDATLFQKATLGSDSSIKSGQTILFVLPDDLRKTLVLNVLSKDSKDENGKTLASWHIVTTGASPTVSILGAPAVNLDGNVVGFAVLQVSGMQTLGIDIISKIASDMVTAKESQS